jgi:hypothetical protein
MLVMEAALKGRHVVVTSSLGHAVEELASFCPRS